MKNGRGSHQLLSLETNESGMQVRFKLAGYAASAAHLIWVVGTQKIVASLEEGMERLEEYTFPLENARALNAYGVDTSIGKLLIVNREFIPGRTTMSLVKENLGF